MTMFYSLTFPLNCNPQVVLETQNTMALSLSLQTRGPSDLASCSCPWMTGPQVAGG